MEFFVYFSKEVALFFNKIAIQNFGKGKNLSKGNLTCEIGGNLPPNMFKPS